MIYSSSSNIQYKFDQKVVLVTGASGWIGSGIARAFGAAGAKVAIHYQNNRTNANLVKGEIESNGGQAMLVQADLCKKAETQRIVSEVATHWNSLDIMINNAGVYPVSPLLDMPEDQWVNVVESNLHSVFYCSQAVAAWMVTAGVAGNIINISSIEGSRPADNHAHYNAAKAGVNMFTQEAAREFAPYGIRVNAISPGLIWVDGIEKNWPEGVEAWQTSAPLKRLGLPEDIANACLFLAAAESSWITGANLVVDGGASTRPSF